MRDNLNELLNPTDSLETAIQFMYVKGSSLIMNGAWDDGNWEVDWITGGKRYRGVRQSLRGALQEAYENAVADIRLSRGGNA